MAAKTSKRFNIFAGVIVAALLALAGGALYVRLVHAGTGEEASQERGAYDSLIEARDAYVNGAEHPLGYYVSELTLGGTTLESEVHHFSGNGINVSMTLTASDGEAASDYLTIELHRIEAGVVDVLVGSRTVTRQGLAIAEWGDVPEGDYYFVFKKDADNQVLTSHDVVMQGYEGFSGSLEDPLDL